MKKSKLVIEYDFDFEVFGIISSSKGYKLAWEINKRLGVHLIKQPDLAVGFKNKVDRGFPHYSYETQLNRLKLFRNRPVEGQRGKYFLVPEHPHFDFIVLSHMTEMRTHHTVPDVLKQIPSVELVAPIAMDALKSKTNFVF